MPAIKRFLEGYGVGLSILAFIIILAFAPLIFTSPGTVRMDFRNTGQIGDTIGGITAPFIGVLNAILLWWTLRKQRNQFREQRLNDEIDRRIDQLNSSLKSFKIEVELRMPMANESHSVEFLGVHTGRSGLFMARALLDWDVDFDTIYLLKARDWIMSMEGMSDMFVAAFSILRRNLERDANEIDKIFTYRETMKLLFGVDGLYSSIGNYMNRHEVSPAVEIYSLRDFYNYGQAQLELLKSYNPIKNTNTLEEEPTTNQGV